MTGLLGEYVAAGIVAAASPDMTAEVLTSPGIGAGSLAPSGLTLGLIVVLLKVLAFAH